MSNKNLPTIVLLSKVKHKKDSFICEYLSEVVQPEIPQSLIDGIFVTLVNGEKYKVASDAIRAEFKLEAAVDQLVSIGIPREIDTIEIVIDTDAAEKAINNQTTRMLDSIFCE